MGTSARSPETNWKQLTLFSEEIPASETAMPGGTATAVPLSEANFCVLLRRFVLALCFERIRPVSGKMRRGRGGNSAAPWSSLATAWCPSASGRVALARTINGTACSCSPSMRAPNARDWKGQSAQSWRTRTNGDRTPTLPDQIGGTPHPEFVEALMGFPIGWTDCAVSATPSRQRWRNGSRGASSTRRDE